ncbi:MAG: glutathione S-transferase family protein [Pseudomonadota bacterium]
MRAQQLTPTAFTVSISHPSEINQEAMMTGGFSDTVKAANNALSAKKTKTIGAKPGETPRFEVYHATFSVCSHKVRTVLLEKNIPFVSHTMNLAVSASRGSDTYHPDYVRLRLLGAPGAKMVGTYTGQSSVTSEGFDPCVVPTLVDHLHQRVVIDSSNICDYLDRETDPQDALVPIDMADAVAAQIALIDHAPHVAVLYGAHPDEEDKRPDIIADRIKGVHDHKVKHLEALKASVADQPDLVAAYDAKIAKELSAKGFVYDRDRMLDAHARMVQHVAALETQLGSHGGKWTMGDDYTMADIMWTISLFRLKWLGLGTLWENSDSSPNVARYVGYAFERPGFKAAVVDWPMSTPPSQHIPGTDGFAKKIGFVWQAIRLG